MSKYEVTENVLNAKRARYEVRVKVSADESTFLYFPSNPSSAKIDAEVDIFLKNRAVEKLQREIEELRSISAFA